MGVCFKVVFMFYVVIVLNLLGVVYVQDNIFLIFSFYSLFLLEVVSLMVDIFFIFLIFGLLIVIKRGKFGSIDYK